MRKKTLIITYYWPPSGGSAVQRWVKFVKYLRDFGWEPIVYAPLNPQYPVTDQSFIKDIPDNIKVLKKKIWEPYRLFKWFTGRGKTENLITGFTSESKKSKFRDNISNWIRSNFFIPDARKFWIKPSVNFLSRYLKTNTVDIIITNGPPHSMHLIGLKLKQRLNIKWVADFRDPWTKIDFYSDLLLTKYADNKHHKLEKVVLEQADQIIVVTKSVRNDFAASGVKNIAYIPNGFEENDFPDNPVEMDHKFTIVHAGVLNKARDPKKLWQVLAELIKENKDFDRNMELLLLGNIDYSIIENLSGYNLDKHYQKINFMPHDQIIHYLRKAQVLLLPINNTTYAKGTIPGKLFEYLAAKRPVIVIGPTDGDVAAILNETKSGKTFDFDDIINLKSHLLNLFEKYKTGILKINPVNIERYSRKNLTAEIAAVLNKLTGIS